MLGPTPEWLNAIKFSRYGLRAQNVLCAVGSGRDPYGMGRIFFTICIASSIDLYLDVPRVSLHVELCVPTVSPFSHPPCFGNVVGEGQSIISRVEENIRFARSNTLQKLMSPRRVPDGVSYYSIPSCLNAPPNRNV